ncbi:MAG: zinc carboxypeptidase family protein [Rhodoferax sp.]|nr:zinc carboxypeptidase family protein [Rhodoferax sp.]
MVRLSTHSEAIQARVGDVLVPLDQPQARDAAENQEPDAHDSFVRWGFLNSVLEKKQASISAYVFEATASQMLAEEPALRQAFDEWKAAHPTLQAVLGHLFINGRRHAEPGWRRYPVAALI